MKLPVYSRADLSRTLAVVVALSSTAVSTSAVAREFRTADTQSEDYPTVQAQGYMGRLIAERSGGGRPRTKSLMASSTMDLSAWRFTTQGARSIYSSVRPFRAIADIKGLRLRVQQSELMSSGVN
jgi:TRAP-type C4-dicarboxylate transport system substrate-binding protein